MSDTAAERAKLALKRPDLLREEAFIGGAWRGGEETIAVVNPATRGAIGAIPDVGAAGAKDAVAAAAAAFPAWRARSAKERATLLRRWFDGITAHLDDLARLMVAEQGKPLAEARGEVAYAAAFVEWFAEEARRLYGDVIPGPRADVRIHVTREPVGPVAAITPWNFPAAMITRKVAPALAAGCTVVLKPSELTPFSALALALLAQEAEIPPGVFSVATGHAGPIGEVLTGDPRLRKFTFTGSTAVGKMLAARCMETVKRVSLELGGNAPLLVFRDADLDAAVAGAVQSKFRNTGQTCVCANRIIVHEDIAPAFVEALAERAKALRVGDGLAGETDQGPLINDKAVGKVERHVADAKAGGAALVVGGARHEAGAQFFQPTVLDRVSPDALLCREETFGPVAGVLRFRRDAEAIALANATEAGLAAYMFTRDLDRAAHVSEQLQCGMVGLNTGIISTEVAPFGGVKDSGFGREGSKFGIDEFVSLKSVFQVLRPADVA